MSWQPYSLDKVAQQLVIEAQKCDPDSLAEAYKMRTNIAYGLERFWGEQIREAKTEKERNKRKYWKATWDELVKVMKNAGVIVPNDPNPEIQAGKLWGDKCLLDAEELPTCQRFSNDDRQVTLAVLLQLCDCLVWWTQRYKKEPPREQVTLDTNDE